MISHVERVQRLAGVAFYTSAVRVGGPVSIALRTATDNKAPQASIPATFRYKSHTISSSDPVCHELFPKTSARYDSVCVHGIAMVMPGDRVCCLSRMICP